MMDLFEAKPWLETISSDPRWVRPIPETTTIALLDSAVARFPDLPAIRYYGCDISWGELDRLSSAFAAYLVDNGFEPGDRLAIYLQNVPHYPIALFGAWKAGGVVVPLNPMYRDELEHILADSGAVALIASAEAYLDRVHAYAHALPIVVTCNDRDFQRTDDERVFGAFVEAYDTGRPDLLSLIGRSQVRKTSVPPLVPDDLAMIAYTSGTSGKSKGAALSHRNLTVNAQRLPIVEDFDETHPIFTLAPVFHITGLACLLSAAAAGAPLVMNHRFDAAVSLEIFRRYRPAYMAAPATAFVALINHPDFSRDAFESFRTLVSGGAPLPEALVVRFTETTGHYVVQGYGLTETTGPCIFVPQNMRAPVDDESGNLSCGLPLANADVRIINDTGGPVGPGEVGELVVRGPMVASEYFNDPESTAKGMPGGELHTGDVGFMDEQGWVYIVDRKKDMINASGFKVWPREVEDVLYAHPEIREAAVVGLPDEYRGETVGAFVTTAPGSELDESEVIEFCRSRLASFKAPRSVEFVDELPKTASGKILRREIRVGKTSRNSS